MVLFLGLLFPTTASARPKQNSEISRVGIAGIGLQGGLNNGPATGARHGEGIWLVGQSTIIEKNIIGAGFLSVDVGMGFGLEHPLEFTPLGQLRVRYERGFWIGTKTLNLTLRPGFDLGAYRAPSFYFSRVELPTSSLGAQLDLDSVFLSAGARMSWMLAGRFNPGSSHSVLDGNLAPGAYLQATTSSWGLSAEYLTLSDGADLFPWKFHSTRATLCFHYDEDSEFCGSGWWIRGNVKESTTPVDALRFGVSIGATWPAKERRERW